MKSYTRFSLKTFCCLFGLLFFVASVPFVSATSWGREYIVVAWDEEFDAHYPYWYLPPVGYPIPLHAKDYIDWQMRRALYWFHLNFGTYVHFEVIGHAQWDSDDSLTSYYLLKEAQRETGFLNGLYFNGVKATLLIAFTYQNNDGLGGGTIPEDHAILVHFQAEWADDNVIMHELSHIYIGSSQPADTPHGDCVMSSEEIYVDFYAEPCMPDDYAWTFPPLGLFTRAKWGYFSYQWCQTCKNIMTATMMNHYDPPPDPWDDALKQDLTGRIVFCTVMMTVIVIIVFVGVKVLRKKNNRLLKNRNSAFYLINCLPIPHSIMQKGLFKLDLPTNYTRPINRYEAFVHHHHGT